MSCSFNEFKEWLRPFATVECIDSYNQVLAELEKQGQHLAKAEAKLEALRAKHRTVNQRLYRSRKTLKDKTKDAELKQKKLSILRFCNK